MKKNGGKNLDGTIVFCIQKIGNGNLHQMVKRNGSAITISPTGEQCVTSYAKLSMRDDICESLAAYIHTPEVLKAISLDKFNILQRHDAQQQMPQILSSRVPKSKIQLPEIKPETVFII